MQVELSPISDPDVPLVARFLDAHMDSPLSEWDSALAVPWTADAPNRGFMLREGERIVGAYVAYYSSQSVGGREETFCNLGTWFVLPEFRTHSLRLLDAMLSQDGVNFTDLTPSKAVTRINGRFGFRTLDADAGVLLRWPWPARSKGARIAIARSEIEAALEGPDLRAYRDHAGAPGAIHAAIERGGRSCYVVARRDRTRGLTVLRALHVSDPGLFLDAHAPLTRRLLTAHRALGLVVEDRLVGSLPRGALPLRSRQARMFRGDHLEPGDVGYLYTELVCLPSD